MNPERETGARAAGAAGAWVSQVLHDGYAILENVLSQSQLSGLLDAFAGLGAGPGLRNVLQDLPAVGQLARDLIRYVAPILGPNAFAVRGLFFDKQPGANCLLSSLKACPTGLRFQT